jgi:hypothetical protein
MPSQRQQALDADGTFNRVWFLFFQILYERAGGATGPSTTELDLMLFEDAGSGEIVAMLNDMRQQFSLSPSMPEMSAQIDFLTGENNDMREQITELQRAVNDLRQSTII